MHPAFLFRHFAPRFLRTCHGRGAWKGHGPGGHPWGGREEEMDDDCLPGGGFGVRRPLRFLAHKLDLDDRQIAALARILDELRTERAQAEVDRRRTLSAFADSISGDAFDAAKAGEGGDLRLQSAERLRQAVLKALGQIHAMLNAEQRATFSYLIRTGTITM
jgi:Spy/CpxP family protein refolding chaperone